MYVCTHVSILPIYLSHYQFYHVSMYLPNYLYMYASIYVSIYLSICVSILLPINLSLCTYVCMYVCISLSIQPSTCMSVCHSRCLPVRRPSALITEEGKASLSAFVTAPDERSIIVFNFCSVMPLDRLIV